MSLIAADRPLVKSVNPLYSKKLFQFNDLEILTSVGSFHKVRGFDTYNYLIDVNRMFSSQPRFDPVDRTDLAQGPVVYSPERKWKVPAQELSLNQALQCRVNELTQRGCRLNLLWSGGIDSTAIAVAFLKHCTDLKALRILYSPWSTYEHPEFYKLLQDRSDIELLDISGEQYLDLDLDGIFISGDCGDELHASLDQSFFERHGYEFLFSSWKDFFYSQLPDHSFIDFCEQHFSAAGKPIQTVLDARWWFYASCKLTSILNSQKLSFFTSGHSTFDPTRLVGFFNCDAYEQFIYFNTDQIVLNSNYASWRQFLKDYCCEFDNLEHWRINKEKFNSSQMQKYTLKKEILRDQRNIMLLDNGLTVATPNLPFFGRSEWEAIKHNYQHVFRTPAVL